MQLFRRLSLLLIIVLFYSYLKAQENSYTITIKDQSSWQNLLLQFESNFNVNLAYPSDLFHDVPLPIGEFSGSSPQDLLSLILKDQEIAYKVLEDNKILLRSENENFNLDQNLIGGRLVDKISKDPVAFAHIIYDDGSEETFSNEDGSFSLPVNQDNEVEFVLVNLLGFNQLEIPVEKLTEDITWELIAAEIEIDEILVEDKTPVTTINSSDISTHIDVDAASASNSSPQGNDVMRMIQELPGVAHHDDLSSDIKIRGSEGIATLTLIDGIPTYKANHFFGIFSAMNPGYVEEAVLYKNTYPIQYGGRSGGLLLLSSEGQSDRFSGNVNLGILETNASLQQPLSENWSFHVAGRTTNGNVADSEFYNYVDAETPAVNDAPSPRSIISSTPDFRYYDINSKLSFETGKDRKFGINYFRSEDRLNDEFDASLEIPRPVGALVVREEFRQVQNWSNEGISLFYNDRISNKLRLESNFHYSHHFEEAETDSGISLKNRNIDRSYDFSIFWNNKVEDAGGYIKLIKEINGQDYLEFGVDYKKLSTDLTIADVNDSVIHLMESGNTASIFLNYSNVISRYFEFSTGTRVNYFNTSGQLYFSPRINLILHASSDLDFKASFSRNYQFVRELDYENRFGQNFQLLTLSDDSSVPIGSTYSYMAGVTYKKNRFTFDFELYYKDMEGTVELSLTNPRLFRPDKPDDSREYKLFTGEGRSYGGEVFMTYTGKKYTGRISYTLSRFEEKYNRVFKGQYFRSQDDRPHQLSLFQSYDIGNFVLSMNYSFASGRPYVDLSKLKEARERENIDPDEILSFLPDYSRLDFGVAYKFKLGNVDANIKASVYNVTNRENVKYLQFISGLPIDDNLDNTNEVFGTETGLLDRTFNLQLGLKF